MKGEWSIYSLFLFLALIALLPNTFPALLVGVPASYLAVTIFNKATMPLQRKTK